MADVTKIKVGDLVRPVNTLWGLAIVVKEDCNPATGLGPYVLSFLTIAEEILNNDPRFGQLHWVRGDLEKLS